MSLDYSGMCKKKNHQSKNGWRRRGRELSKMEVREKGVKIGRQTECSSNTVRMSEGREVDDWGQKVVKEKRRTGLRSTVV